MAELTRAEAMEITKSVCVGLGREARAAGFSRSAFRNRGCEKLVLQELGEDGRPRVRIRPALIPFSGEDLPPFHSGVGISHEGDEHEWFLEGMGED